MTDTWDQDEDAGLHTYQPHDGERVPVLYGPEEYEAREEDKDPDYNPYEDELDNDQEEESGVGSALLAASAVAQSFGKGISQNMAPASARGAKTARGGRGGCGGSAISGKSKKPSAKEARDIGWDHPPYDEMPGVKEFHVDTGVMGAKPKSVLESFDSFFKVDSVVSLFVKESNVRAAVNQTQEGHVISDKDIYGFLSVIIFMGLCQLPAEGDYWSGNILAPSFVADVMPRDTFKRIKRNLSVANPSKEENEKDRLAKVRPLLNVTNDIIKQNYVPDRDLGLDESCCQCGHRYARCSYRATHYKPTKDFVKVFAIHESKTGYCCCFLVDERSGKSTHDSVMQLCSMLHQHPYFIATDRFYTCQETARALLEKGMYMYGTLASNRRYPNALKTEKKGPKLEPGQFRSAFAKDLYCCIWRDSCEEGSLFLSSRHGDKAGTVMRRVKGSAKQQRTAPQVAIDYNKCMGPCDRANALRENYSSQLTHQHRWYMTLVYYCIEVLIINAYIAYKLSGDNQKSHKEFRVDLARALAKRYKSSDFSPAKRKRGMSAELNTVRLTAAEHLPVDAGKEKRCKFCYAKFHTDSKTNMMCCKCKVHLHAKECFFYFHTEKEIKFVGNK